jgi:hypothetical protein
MINHLPEAPLPRKSLGKRQGSSAMRFFAGGTYPTPMLANCAQNARIAELERKLALAQLATGKVPQTVAEMVAMKRVGDEVEAAKRAANKAARQAKAPAVNADETLETLAEKLRQREQQLKGAQTRVRNLNNRLIAATARKTIPMSKALVRYIRSTLHPERRATDPRQYKRRLELSKEFNSFKFIDPGDGG